MMDLAKTADRYQISSVQETLEGKIMKTLNIETCGCILAEVAGSGLVDLERASRTFALRNFDDFAETSGFMALDVGTVESILGDDTLTTEREDNVLDALMRWMQHNSPGDSGKKLLRKVRYPLMQNLAVCDEILEVGSAGGLEQLLREAQTLRATPRYLWDTSALSLLDPVALTPRRGRKDLPWLQYTPTTAVTVGAGRPPAGGSGSTGERRIACAEAVHAVAVHGGLLCGGLHSGTILVWDRTTLTLARTLAGHKRQVNALVSWEGWLVSASSDCRLRAWDMEAGRCEAVLEGHGDWVSCVALSVCGGARLVSGSWDRSLRVWRLGPAAAQWRCERTLCGHEGAVYCVAACGGSRVVSGAADRSVRVWDTGTGAAVATLRGHSGAVTAVAADGERVMSAAEDGTVRVWVANTWAGERVVEVSGGGCGQHVRCLAVSGSKLVGGSYRYRPSRNDAAEVRAGQVALGGEIGRDSASVGRNR